MPSVTDKETRRDPPPTTDEAPGRVTAETVVTDGRRGLDRLRQAAEHILKVPKKRITNDG